MVLATATYCIPIFEEDWNAHVETTHVTGKFCAKRGILNEAYKIVNQLFGG
jgi:hypothetical protein